MLENNEIYIYIYMSLLLWLMHTKYISVIFWNTHTHTYIPTQCIHTIENTCICIHACLQIYIYIYIYVHASIRLAVCMHASVYMLVKHFSHWKLNVCVCVCVFISVQVCVWGYHTQDTMLASAMVNHWTRQLPVQPS